MENDISKFREKIQSYGQREQEQIEKALAEEAEASRDSAGTGRIEKADPARMAGIASILIELNLDGDTITAALLLGNSGNSGGVPPGKPPNEGIGEKFGRHVALLVEEVRKIGDISARNKTIQEAENIRKMLFAMTTDIRVIFIKLAERLYTMRTPESRSNSGEMKALARECLDIYAPLAGRLGISWIKDELEDLALKHLNRDVYNQIKEIVSEKRGERTEFLSLVQEDIRREAAAIGIPIEVSSRAKHFYSIYQKMRKRNKATGDLYDLFGIRILCDSIENCYTLLGMVHRRWKPLDGRFKDYIAMPKSNGYQSLHTTVFVPEAAGGNRAPGIPDEAGGRMLEIQIRTGEMHHIAEYGIASHWLYKKGSTRELIRPVDISIVNRLRDWKQMEDSREKGMDARNSKSFLEDIKRELLKDSIYVFTPQGKVIELPVGASPIDFAYSVHSAIGEHCIGAKADGSIIPLSSELRNTQVVEILTSPRARPHLNWLRIVKTARARSKIRSWLEQNDDSIIIERNVVAKKKPGSPQEAVVPSGAPVKEIPVVQRVSPDPAANKVLQVRVESGQGSYEKNIMIRFARCCRPVTGDPIVGYVSRGRGIIVHRKNCGNLANIPDFEERKIDTEWENAVSVLVRRFKIDAKLSADMFSEIEGAVRKYQGHLIEGRLEETAANRLTGFFTMQLEQAGDLKKVVKNIRGIPGVLNIQPI
jgi:GTP pyrophosphokinase